MINYIPTVAFIFAFLLVSSSNGFGFASKKYHLGRKALTMNVFEDAFRYFTNLNKEASAKHILLKGTDASARLSAMKTALMGAEDISTAFSELAMKVSECPSAKRGGNLGTFKPGMMVKEFDRVVFEKPVGEVHGPVETQFGSHLILITRRFDGKNTDSMTRETPTSVR